MGTKFPFFNFPVCKMYLGTWARRVRRARGQVGHAFFSILCLTSIYSNFFVHLNSHIGFTLRTLEKHQQRCF